MSIDFMGFIFFDKSKRFLSESITPNVLSSIPKNISKTGVFVNQNINTILSTIDKYKLNYVQLHGNESIEYCKEFYNKNIKIIKAFSVDNDFSLEITKKYEPYCNYFLFDTKGKYRGGNGVKFNWLILKNYESDIPFFLSGGINPIDAEEIINLRLEKLFCIDINSGFEKSPGIKDIELIYKFINKIKHSK